LKGDAAAQALRCLPRCTSPTTSINVSGADILAVRDLAFAIGDRLGVEPRIAGEEQPTAWITDTREAVRPFGLPVVDMQTLVAWTYDWVARDMPSLGKPIRFEVRDGRY
jgi:hypothetical protein